jgi:hypothetical protein
MRVFWVVLVLIAIAGVAAALVQRARREQAASPAEVAAQLRESVFTSDPAKLGIPLRPGEAWGIVMDTSYPKAVASLVSLADGSASIYISSGGGYIGGQGRPAVRDAAKAFVRAATANLSRLARVSEHPLPSVGRTRFYVLTPEGLFTAEAAEKELGENHHALSPLFHAGQDVITQFRLTSGKTDGQ